MKGTGAKHNVCPGSCVSTGAKFPVAPVESAPMLVRDLSQPLWGTRHTHNVTTETYYYGHQSTLTGR